MPTNGKPGCSESACIVGSCNAGFADCNQNRFDGCEVDTTSNARNCGACGAACPAGANTIASCQAGKCMSACKPGYADCNGLSADGCEVATAADSQNCGACGSLCVTLPNATPVCTAGACIVSACVTGFFDCDHQNPNGCEVNASTDLNNCGGCGTVCGALPNAVPGCVSGACGIASCNANFGDCDALPANGCEVSLKADASNCGACSHVCALPFATSNCTAGACAITGCTVGHADCNHIAADGCEASPGSDALNCGSCGNQCPTGVNGVNGCVNAVCAVVSCKAGFADCNGQAGDGCEVNLTTDLANCGGCKSPCGALANATVACSSGKCVIGKCDAGYGNCNGTVADGCEKNLTADVKNCGACAAACSSNNDTPSCANSLCSIICNAGYDDCNGQVSDGCETNLKTDAKNCSACAAACSTNNDVPTCGNGSCMISCAAGFGDCNHNIADGCENPLDADLLNCGACGNQCSMQNNTPTCSKGACVFACNAGYGNCDKNPANGCEDFVTTDAKNCGACGVVCSTQNCTSNCVGGACAIVACNANFADCDAKAATGCEANLLTDANNCGKCGTVCGGSCTAGKCTTVFSLAAAVGYAVGSYPLALAI